MDLYSQQNCPNLDNRFFLLSSTVTSISLRGAGNIYRIYSINAEYPVSKVNLAGDFNSAGIDWRKGCLTDSYISKSFREFLIDISSDYFLEQIVSEPTRGRNLLDLYVLLPIQIKLSSVTHYPVSVIMRQ